jgi:hypothetical protein
MPLNNVAVNCNRRTKPRNPSSVQWFKEGAKTSAMEDYGYSLLNLLCSGFPSRERKAHAQCLSDFHFHWQ